MKLLFRTAEWHALAKLWLHTDFTLTHMENLTKEFGQLMRKFRNLTCSAFSTVELPREVDARTHRKAATTTKHATPTDSSGSAPIDDAGPLQPPLKLSSPKKKQLNLFTYKWHSLGDYIRTIRMFGGTDSYSTQIVSVIYFSHSF